MSCKEIDEFLDDRVSRVDTSVPGWVAAHCRQCARCQQLLDLLKTQVRIQPPPADLLSRVDEVIAGSLRAVTPLSPARSFVLGFLAIFVALAVGGIVTMGVGATRVMSIWQFAGVGSILGAGAVLLAISLSRQMTPGSYQKVRPAALVFSLVACFLLALLLLFPWKLDGDFVSVGLRCASAGLMLIVPASVCLWFLVRRGAVLSPGPAGGTIGLLAGLVGATALHFGCEIATAPHLVVWHAGIPVFCALAGFLLGRFSGRERSGKHDSRP